MTMRRRVLVCACAVLGVALLLPLIAGGEEEPAFGCFWGPYCASCHADDTPTCDGCHHHTTPMWVTLDQDVVPPGSRFRARLRGGQQGGWIRALLYDENGVEVARRSGPTGSGDDGQTWRVQFPVILETIAPTAPGAYTWEAAWYGSDDSQVGVHAEYRVPVFFIVETGVSAVPDDDFAAMPATWSGIKTLYRQRSP
jgi:hypothetical protein